MVHSLTLQQRLERHQVRLEELVYWTERQKQPLTSLTLEGESANVGTPWPGTDGVFSFTGTGTVPADWSLADCRLRMNLGGEGLVMLSDDQGAATGYGIDPYHRSFPLKSHRFSFTAECTARLPFGEPVRAPRIEWAELVWVDTAVEQLHLLMQQIAEAAETLKDHEVVPHLLDLAEKAFYQLDWPSATEHYISRTAQAPLQQKIWQLPATRGETNELSESQRQNVLEIYQQLLGELAELQKRFPPEGEIALSGHAHIDLCWLWPYDETRRKLRRTFHTALSLMEQSAEFRFNQSTAHYYWQISQMDPTLLEKITERVKTGQWETLGGLWVEPDTNMPTGESLARQVLYGQQFFEQQFGIRHDTCWMPDCFGFTGALPQLLQQGGMKNFFTIKVNWSETNRFPADLFWWEGLDGSRVLMHTFDNPMQGYNGFVHPHGHRETWKNFRGKDKHPQTLLTVGYGDGGGGPVPEMITREEQLKVFPALPKARWATVKDFFASANQSAERKALPVWAGEIYLELHRATLTTQGRVKKAHRDAEQALISAEIAGSLAHMLGADAPDSLRDQWRYVLKNEFHDILPGSSIREVNIQAVEELTEVIHQAGEYQQGAMQALVGQLPATHGEHLVVVNPSLDCRPLETKLDDGSVLSTDTLLPPLSVAVVDPQQLQPAGALSVSETHLENRHIRVLLNADGTLASILHKASGRETLADRGNQLWAYTADKPRNWDAWDVEEDFAARGEEIIDLQSLQVVESGSHRVAIRLVRQFRDSHICQTYSLTANGKRLDIHTELDWHDRRILLKTLTPVAVKAREATCECAYGVVKRPTHENTSWDAAMFEAAAHRFADLSEPGFGVALLNDGKYGHSIRNNVLALSLLRSPIYPDPLADEGEQQFTYALYPHSDEWYRGGVREEAEALNRPLLISESQPAATGLYQPIKLSGPVSLSGFKPAEDGQGLILRVYEPAGGRGSLEMGLTKGWKNAGPVTVLEEPMNVSANSIKPFEIKNFRLCRD
ncbi:alpha-mannosidase [Gynuella sp.]|uniref:alpha-mannosidase n=1 Tax=Gynuella sp. TaxID=2969146 RepID=UPI003D124015